MKFYVVWHGHDTGVYDNWKECKQQIEGCQGALYKSFPAREQAVEAYRLGRDEYYRTYGNALKKAAPLPSFDRIEVITDSLAVDAACSGNPGKMEYRGIHLKTAKQVFHFGPVKEGTNNIGEFLAIVHALALLHKHGSTIPIYSDSKIAIGWVNQRTCKTKLDRNERTEPLLQIVERAIRWLNTHTWSNQILKWETERWGEIPADFGRK